MKILVKDPITNSDVEMDAERENYNGEDAWRVSSAEHGSLVLLENNGKWKAAGNRNLVPELIREIGIALHPLAKYNPLS